MYSLLFGINFIFFRYNSVNSHNVTAYNRSKKGVVKKQRSKSQDFLLLGNLDSFLCQIAKITILAEFLVQQTQRQKNCVFAVLKMWKIFLIYAAFFIAGFFKWNL